MKKIIFLLFLTSTASAYTTADVSNAVIQTHPGAQFTVMGCVEYRCLEWLDSSTKPTEDEFNQFISDYLALKSTMQAKLAADQSVIADPNSTDDQVLHAQADMARNKI